MVFLHQEEVAMRAARMIVTGVLTVIMSASPAHGDLVVGNLTIPEVGFGGMWLPEQRRATRLSLGASFQPMHLTSVTARLRSLDVNGSTAHLWLYNDDQGLPGVSVADLGTLHINTTDFIDHTFTFGSSFLLEANTRYWVVMGRELGATGQVDWRTTEPFGVDPGSNPFADIPLGLASSLDFGETWTEGSFFRFMFAVHGTPIPAPGALAPFGLAAAFGTRRRRDK